MKSVSLLTLSFSIVNTHALTGWGVQNQPYVYDSPALLSGLKTLPSAWKHSTPLLSGSEKIVSPDSGAILSRRAAAAAGSWTGWHNVRYIFAFGDSYTSTGFDISGPQPNRGNPLGNPDFPGATSSGGPDYISFLTATYNKSFVQTYNFGFGGATIDNAIVQSPFGTVIRSFKDQVNQEFLPKYTRSSAVPWGRTNSLFIVFFGVNDAINAYNKAQPGDVQYAGIKRYESIVNQLYAVGARNFLFLNCPPMDRAPAATDRAGLARWIGSFNFRLKYLVLNLTKRHSDVTAFHLNTEGLFTMVLNNPARFPETALYHNTTDFCPAYAHGFPTLDYYDPSCGIPVKQYFWVNDLHPTYPMHNFLASQIAKLLQS